MADVPKGRNQERGAMPLAPMARTWARKLLAEEAATNQVSPNLETATLIVYEKTRRRLTASIGLDGFRALAARAVACAKAETHRLDTIQLTADGSICGLDVLEPQSVPEQDDDAGVILIAHLIGLFLTFLGEEATRQLLHDAVPTLSAPTETVPSKLFDGILQEVINLRTASDTLEALASEHPAAETGLLIISANVRNIATLLDVFAVVRNASDTALSTKINELSTQYLM
jgi:hypothetical protein